MAEAFRAAVAYENMADLPTTLVRASSSAPFLPPQLLRDPHIGRKWRALGASAALFVDFGQPTSFDTLALVGANVTGSMRVRGSLTSSEMTSGALFDVARSGGDLRYRYQIALLDDPIAVRFLRIDLENGSADPVEAGRLFTGIRHQFGINFTYGWEPTWVDPSRKTKSDGGATHILRKRRYRTWSLPFEHITEAERWGFVEDMDARVGGSTDILMLSHPLEPNFGQRAIWGLMPEPTPTPETYFGNFAKTYTIEERL